MPPKLEEKTYVKCKVEEGIFLSEYFVGITDFYGNLVGGFADKKSVKIEKEPKEGETLEGLARVWLIEENKDKYLIQLPTEQQDRIYISSDKLEIFI